MSSEHLDPAPTFDVKKAFPELYAPRPGVMAVVEVPEQQFLMVDGHGDPNVSPAYAEAVEALYAVSYAARAAAKGLPGLGRVRFGRYQEGTSVQVLHVGPYDDEGPVLARMHEEFIPEHGYVLRGRHHEVYLSDPRRTEPAKLRTILRQPVDPAP
jgi:hypothetical protein